jgi:hypothetical protein
MEQIGGFYRPLSASIVAISLRKFFNLLGYSGFLFIVYGVISTYTEKVWPPFEQWVTPISSLFTLIGTLVTAISIYFYRPQSHRPERFSLFISAPLVIICSILAIIVLVKNGSLPQVVVNVFALLGISGGLFRIQQRTTE